MTMEKSPPLKLRLEQEDPTSNGVHEKRRAENIQLQEVACVLIDYRMTEPAP